MDAQFRLLTCQLLFRSVPTEIQRLGWTTKKIFKCMKQRIKQIASCMALLSTDHKSSRYCRAYRKVLSSPCSYYVRHLWRGSWAWIQNVNRIERAASSPRFNIVHIHHQPTNAPTKPTTSNHGRHTDEDNIALVLAPASFRLSIVRQQEGRLHGVSGGFFSWSESFTEKK